MKRADLEHLIRAAGSIAETDEVIIIGSQAILAAFPEAPAELVVSQEADMYPADNPARADIIDGSIGELSPFHEQFGYYAHGVGPETATLPSGWQGRLIAVASENTRGVTGRCLHPSDLAVSKLVAGRPKDIEFVAALIRHQLVQAATVRELAATLPDIPRQQAVVALNRILSDI